MESEGQVERWTGTWPLQAQKIRLRGVSGVQGTRRECHEMNAVSRQGPGAGRPSGALSGVMKPARFPVLHSINFKVNSVHKESKVADAETLPDPQRRGQFAGNANSSCGCRRGSRPCPGMFRLPHAHRDSIVDCGALSSRARGSAFKRASPLRKSGHPAHSSVNITRNAESSTAYRKFAKKVAPGALTTGKKGNYVRR